MLIAHSPQCDKAAALAESVLSECSRLLTVFILSLVAVLCSCFHKVESFLLPIYKRSNPQSHSQPCDGTCRTDAFTNICGSVFVLMNFCKSHQLLRMLMMMMIYDMI